jgi:hypothetical protein
MNIQDIELQNIIEKTVMGVLDRQKAQKNQNKNHTQPNTQPNTQTNTQTNTLNNNQQLSQLSHIELKYLITLIGKSDFKGSDLQVIYSITAKLQNQLTIKK